MGYPRGTPGRRLFLFLMEGKGSRTLWEISRRNADGRLLARGRKELGDLIIEEKGHAVGSRRRVTRVVITLRGWAAAAELRPSWTPKRRPLDDLKVELRERQAEGEPWANQFLKDAAAAQQLERLKANGWIRRPRKSWITKTAAKLRAAGKDLAASGVGRYEPPAAFVDPRDHLGNPTREPKRKLRPRGRPFASSKIPGRQDVTPRPTSSGSGWHQTPSIPPTPSSHMGGHMGSQKLVADAKARADEAMLELKAKTAKAAATLKQNCHLCSNGLADLCNGCEHFQLTPRN